MSKATDQAFLLKSQYRNASNLDARVALHARFSTNPYGWHRWMFDQLDVPETGEVLELGCGPGHLWRENRERVPPGWRIVLSDLSPGMLEEAKRSLAAIVPNPSFEVVDAQAIPFEDARFDAVIANHMLYHVPDRAKALSEVRRVLKPGGTLYAATNGAGHLRELFEIRRRCGLPSLSGAEAVSSIPFTLENGWEQLTPWFGDVRVLRYEDALRVTEVEPLLAYVRSGLDPAAEVEGRITEMRRVLGQELEQQGAIEITKSAGLFVASQRVAA